MRALLWQLREIRLRLLYKIDKKLKGEYFMKINNSKTEIPVLKEVLKKTQIEENCDH